MIRDIIGSRGGIGSLLQSPSLGQFCDTRIQCTANNMQSLRRASFAFAPMNSHVYTFMNLDSLTDE